MSITWHNKGRGPRIFITLGNDEYVVSVARARELRDELSRVLGEIEAAGDATKGPTG